MSQKYRMLTSIGSSEGWSYSTGKEVTPGDSYTESTVLAATLQGWVRAGIAEPIQERPAPVIEAAVAKQPETAMVAGPSPREAEPDTTAPKRRTKRRK
jgi:hypothetical protein